MYEEFMKITSIEKSREEDKKEEKMQFVLDLLKRRGNFGSISQFDKIWQLHGGTHLITMEYHGFQSSYILYHMSQ